MPFIYFFFTHSVRTFRKRGIIPSERGASTMNKSRPRKVLIRLNDDELTQLKAEIKKSGTTQQDYILAKLFSYDKPVIAPKMEQSEVNKSVIAPDEKNMICPKCGAKLVVKNGYRGKFIGCSRWPDCDYSRDYE